MRRKCYLKIIIVIFLFSLLACGGGSTGTGSDSGSFSSGVSRDRLISSINQSELSNICKRAKDFADNVFTTERACTFFGVAFSALDDQGNKEDTCNTLRSDCLKEADSDPATEEDYQCPLAAYDYVTQCSAPISDLENCINDSFDTLESFVKDLTCKNIDKSITDGTEESLKNVSESPACTELKKQCPKIFVEQN